MRTIESKIISAIDRRRPLHVSRNGDIHDEVFIGVRAIDVLLCNHCIAEIWEDSIKLSARGYLTNTTKSRLNALALHFHLPTIAQRNFVWYWSDGQPYDGAREFQINKGASNVETLNSRF